jgi:8-oxo-dGTP pyrophosphatase MutT (NUDIX family)
VIYKPENTVIDFGESAWPPKYKKKDVCPLVLTMQGWTDARLGFVGGKSEPGEDPVETINREFYEETGTKLEFGGDDHLFSCVDIRSQCHIFAKIITDREEFQDILKTFHDVSLDDDLNKPRESYIDEVISLVALPLFVEGPDEFDLDLQNRGWNQIWGLPRYLTTHGGGIFSPTLATNYIVREQFLLILFALDIVDKELMRRIFYLANACGQNSVDLPDYDLFMEAHDEFLEIVHESSSSNPVIQDAYEEARVKREEYEERKKEQERLKQERQAHAETEATRKAEEKR